MGLMLEEVVDRVDSKKFVMIISIALWGTSDASDWTTLITYYYTPLLLGISERD